MVPATGLLQWLQLENQINPAEADLGGLVADPGELIAAPVGMGSAGARPSVEV